MMGPWLETLAVTVLAVTGVGLGLWFSRQRKPYWLLGYFIPLILVIGYAAAARKPALSLIPPISWLVMGRNKFASIALIATMVLTTPLSRIKQVRARVLISILMGLAVVQMSLWPFLAPAFNRAHLASLITQIDGNGVCRQSNDYDCGPAAAVTALRRLGFPAEEGQIAIWAHTSSATGTPPDILAQTLQDRYGKQGLISEYRVFNDWNELQQAGGLVLVVIRYTFWVDHYLTVLEVHDDHVLAGDPSRGLVWLSKNDFLVTWRFVGVVLKRRGDIRPSTVV
jgi:predicted double-glycine peptidase